MIWREDVELLAISAQIINSHSILSLAANKYRPSFQMDVSFFSPGLLAGLLSICQERRVVISSRCLILVNIDSFIGGDRDIINRRLGERRKVSLCFFLFLLVWKRSPNRCLMSWACQIHLVLSRTFNSLLAQPPPAQHIPNPTYSFNTHICTLTWGRTYSKQTPHTQTPTSHMHWHMCDIHICYSIRIPLAQICMQIKS